MLFTKIEVGESYAYRKKGAGDDNVGVMRVASKTQTITGKGGRTSRRSVEGMVVTDGERVREEIDADLILGPESEYAEAMRIREAETNRRDDFRRQCRESRAAFALRLEAAGFEVVRRISKDEYLNAKRENRDPVPDELAERGASLEVRITDYPIK